MPEFFDDRSALRMTTARGRDHISLKLAQHGWLGFEPPVPAVLCACAKFCEHSFFDVGANVGLYSLLVAKAARNIQVHAFEPFPSIATVLSTNVALNRLQQRIRVNSEALADKPGEETLYIPKHEHGGLESSASLNPDFKSAHSRLVRVPVTTVDRYVQQTEPIRIGLMKVDVESTEHQVLSGGHDCIQRDRPIIVLEVLHLGDHAWLDRFCKDNRYEIYTLHPEAVRRRDQVAFDGSAWNQCFCPAEKAQQFAAAIASVGLVYE